MSFADLYQGVLVEGLAAEPVTIVSAQEQGSGCVQVVYQDQNSQPGIRLLFESDLINLRLALGKARWTFDADPIPRRLLESHRRHRRRRALRGATTHRR